MYPSPPSSGVDTIRSTLQMREVSSEECSHLTKAAQPVSSMELGYKPQSVCLESQGSVLSMLFLKSLVLIPREQPGHR